jgi:hypothetical protein
MICIFSLVSVFEYLIDFFSIYLLVFLGPRTLTLMLLVTIKWDESPSRKISRVTYLLNKKIMAITP